ncbi:MAG: CDP-glucose 4,6-dehydratase [Candidatus Wallbacteria bacterium GWC2_49_35]|uniref:CDP-glucose 4,6-dehydratase n=1 Tax=Candidatus Wallbacteria bacterium GWC2_49_35 TaxID=1817813 RepID=A0A1F7WTE1_9BACT|nr:MAG: CDP-glucose 4,6-dehydratase [Candidatus Wallbacteria bacterium GWC2_49_35]HBC76070.1 CDP-glucose 4,6-dehydratase [Candidatus Wallbacteria bacterium]
MKFDVYKSKKVFITGDSGFKGSWLAIWLLTLGAEVMGYSLEPRTSADNYCVCGLDAKYERVNADIRDFEKLSSAVKKFRPEFIFHLAAQPLVLDSYETPRETFDTNVMGTVNVLEAARKTDCVRSVVIVTSDKCYDNRETIYAYREIDPLGGKDPYSASKGAAEIITASYALSFFEADGRAGVASARAGNVFGGGDWAPNRIFPDCIKAISEGRDIIVRNPSAVRPWQHVLEPLGGYLALAEAVYKDKKTFGGAWNFGPQYNNIRPVKALVENIIKSAGRGRAIFESPTSARPKEAGLLYLDVAKALNYLGWAPVFSLEEAVGLSVDEYFNITGDKHETFARRVSHIKKYTDLSGVSI